MCSGLLSVTNKTNGSETTLCICPDEPNKTVLYNVKTLGIGESSIIATARPIVDKGFLCTDDKYRLTFN